MPVTVTATAVVASSGTRHAISPAVAVLVRPPATDPGAARGAALSPAVPVGVIACAVSTAAGAVSATISGRVATSSTPSMPMVRVSENHFFEINKLLDAGAYRKLIEG